MNELEKRASYHRKRLKGLSPFCSMGEGYDFSSVEPDVTKFITKSIGVKNWIDADGNLIKCSGEHFDALLDIIGNEVDLFSLSEKEYDELMDSVFNYFQNELGWIAVSKEFVPHIGICKRPTSAQENALLAVMDNYKRRPQDLNVYCQNKGESAFVKYNLYEITPDDVLKKIHDYFRTGVLAEDWKAEYEHKFTRCPNCRHYTLLYDHHYCVWACSECGGEFMTKKNGNKVEFVSKRMTESFAEISEQISLEGMDLIGIYKTVRKKTFGAEPGNSLIIRDNDSKRVLCQMTQSFTPGQWKYREGKHGGWYTTENACMFLSYTARDNRNCTLEIIKDGFNDMKITEAQHTHYDEDAMAQFCSEIPRDLEDAFKKFGYDLQTVHLKDLRRDYKDIFDNILRRLKSLAGVCFDDYNENDLTNAFIDNGKNNGNFFAFTHYLIKQVTDDQWEEVETDDPCKYVLDNCKNDELYLIQGYKGAQKVSAQKYVHNGLFGNSSHTVGIGSAQSVHHYSGKLVKDRAGNLGVVQNYYIYDSMEACQHGETLHEGIWAYQTIVDYDKGAKQPNKTLVYGNHFLVSRSPYKRDEYGPEWKSHIRKIIEWSQTNNPGMIRATHDYRLEKFGKDCNSEEAFISAIENEIKSNKSILITEELTEAKKKKRPFDSINKNAGNVEHNINMFNMTNSPIDGPCNNPVSGPMGGNVGCCESTSITETSESSRRYRANKKWSEVNKKFPHRYMKGSFRVKMLSGPYKDECGTAEIVSTDDDVGSYPYIAVKLDSGKTMDIWNRFNSIQVLDEGLRLRNGMVEREQYYFDDGNYSYHFFDNANAFGKTDRFAVLVIDYGFDFHYDQQYTDEKTNTVVIPTSMRHEKPKQICYFEFTEESNPDIFNAMLDDDGDAFRTAVKSETERQLRKTEDFDKDAFWDEIFNDKKDPTLNKYRIYYWNTNNVYVPGTDPSCFDDCYTDIEAKSDEEARQIFYDTHEPQYEITGSEEFIKNNPLRKCLGESVSDTVELEYEGLDIGDYEIDWTYEVDRDDILGYLADYAYEKAPGYDTMSDEEFDKWCETEYDKWLDENLDDLIEQYKEQLLDFYLDDAIEDACCNYDPMDYVDWDMMPGGHDYEADRMLFEERSDNDNLDDNFDMFMRGV